MPNEEAVKKRRREIETYTMPEQQRLMRTLMTLQKRCYGSAILMLECGLRSGEALALKWDDVLWSRRTIAINKTLVRLGNQQGKTFVQASAKSKSSNRTIPLSKTAYQTLERLSETAIDPHGYIFSREDNSNLSISYDSLQYHIDAACRQADVAYKGNHAFRHTFATNCYNKGCNVKILSKLQGRVDVTITYNFYIYLYGDALEEMRSIID